MLINHWFIIIIKKYGNNIFRVAGTLSPNTLQSIGKGRKKNEGDIILLMLINIYIILYKQT